MATISNIFDTITHIETLSYAYQRARRSKRYRDYATTFDYRLMSNLLQLQRELVSGNYQLEPYRKFTLREVKERKVQAPAFRDRIVQHAICSVLNPFYERQFIHDSYACRKGKGIHAALKRLRHMLLIPPPPFICV